MIRKRLSYANVMATLALFVALGGVGYAAVHLRRDSVGSRQIKENAVKASEQAPNSVDGSNVIDESLGGADIADGSIGSGDIADNAIGSAKIADGSIGGGDIGTGEVGAAQIGDGSVGRAELAPVDLRTPTFDDCAPSTPWQAVPNLPVHYWKDDENMVHLEGAVQCSANITSAPIFQIPRVVGNIYDPADTQDVARFATLGAGLSIAQVAIVKNSVSTGVVYDGGSAANTETYVSLDGLEYRAQG